MTSLPLAIGPKQKNEHCVDTEDAILFLCKQKSLSLLSQTKFLCGVQDDATTVLAHSVVTLCKEVPQRQGARGFRNRLPNVVTSSGGHTRMLYVTTEVNFFVYDETI